MKGTLTGNLNIVRALLDANAQVNYQDKDGVTSLMIGMIDDSTILINLL